MKRNKLISEIANFGIKHKIFNTDIEIDEIKIRIGYILDEAEYIESLINTIIVRTKKQKNIDYKKLKTILLELETIRLELEYGEEKNCLTKKMKTL